MGPVSICYFPFLECRYICRQFPPPPRHCGTAPLPFLPPHCGCRPDSRCTRPYRTFRPCWDRCSRYPAVPWHTCRRSGAWCSSRRYSIVCWCRNRDRDLSYCPRVSCVLHLFSFLFYHTGNAKSRFLQIYEKIMYEYSEIAVSPIDLFKKVV